MNSHHMVCAAIALASRSRKNSECADRENALRVYWADSQCRLQRWQDSIHGFELKIRNSNDLDVIDGREFSDTLDELLFAGVLTAVATAQVDLDEQPEPDCNPMAHSVFEAERSARRRVCQLLDKAAKKNARLRKPQQHLLNVSRGRLRAEMWTDILLGYQSPQFAEWVHPLAFNKTRLTQFNSNIGALQQQGNLIAFTEKLLGDVDAYFGAHPPRISGNEELNQRINASIRSALNLPANDALHVAPTVSTKASVPLSGLGRRNQQSLSSSTRRRV